MKKIFIILTFILLIGCSKKEEYKLFEGEYEILNDYINIDRNWSEKSGMYGIFLTDYENFIIINKIDEDENLDYKIYEDINFYLPKHFNIDKHTELKLENDEFCYYKYEGDYQVSKGKIFKDGGKSIYVMISVKEGDINNLYEKTFK